MRIEITSLVNWSDNLAECVRMSEPGDIIAVPTESMAELGQRAAVRTKGKDHGVTFEVVA